MNSKSYLKTILFFVLSLSFMVSCSPPKEPEFRDVTNVNVKNFSTSSVTISADAILYNPNKMAAVLKEINVVVWIDGKEVGTVQQESNIEVKGMEEFAVPLELSFSPNKIFDNVLSGAMSLLSNKKFTIEYKGYIRVKIAGITIKVPVNDKTSIRLR